MTRLDDERYYAELEAQTAALAEAVRGADPSTKVPTCPEWTVVDLVEHVGRGQRWAATMVETRTVVPVRQTAVQAPADAAGWLRAGARRLADAVREAGPGTAVWSWSPDRTAGFWLRKIAHDTLVHRWDADLTVGRDPEAAPELAADCVSDLLDAIAALSGDHEDPVFAGLRGTGESLHFHATDTAGEWLVRRTPSAVEWEPGHGRAGVAVRGRAVDLALLLNRRGRPAVEVIGDDLLLAHWLENGAFA